MADAPKPKFDPVKLEQLNVATDYPMDKEEFEILYRHNCYCEMAHVNSKGFPIVTPMFYVVIDDIIHMSSIQKYRHKVHHLEKDPRISVSIHNDGSNVRHQKAILVIGKAEVSKDEELMKKVHWDIIDKYFFELKTEEERQNAFTAVHTPLRVIIKVHPEKIITWDFGKMLEAHDDGVWFGEANWQQNQYDIRRLNLNPPGS
ncbi:MAG: pyridoxamine 5'-phosphate oxidase [Gammaproteobacteria bacterium]|nr:MAG: pyridoxamine 5'-phosphate oxidase [Gammaproteobacteria bacterium]